MEEKPNCIYTNTPLFKQLHRLPNAFQTKSAVPRSYTPDRHLPLWLHLVHGPLTLRGLLSGSHAPSHRLGGFPRRAAPLTAQSQHYGHDTPSPSRSSMFPNPAPPKTQAPLLSHSVTAPTRFRNDAHLSANSGLLSARSSMSLLWSRPF